MQRKSNKKSKGVNFIIPLHVYPFDVMFSFAQEDEQLAKILDQHGVSEEEVAGDVWKYKKPTVQGRTIQFSGNQTLLRMRRIPKHPMDKGYLAHEIFHVVTFILDRVGINFDLEKSDEAYAYLTGYITTEVYTKLKI